MSGDASTPRSILVASQVTRRFGGLVAVNSVDFTIPEGSIVSLIGPNGAGKTTFFNVLLGVIDPSAGEVKFHGRRMIARPERIALRVARVGLPAIVVGGARGDPRRHGDHLRPPARAGGLRGADAPRG